MDKEELRERLTQEQQSLTNLEKGVRECIESIKEDQHLYLRCQRQGLYGQVKEQRQKVKRLEKELSI